jgi:hypothetical protein
MSPVQFTLSASGVCISSIGSPIGMSLNSQSPMSLTTGSIINLSAKTAVTIVTDGGQGVLIKATDGGDVDIISDSGNVRINGKTIEVMIKEALQKYGIID